MSEQLFDLNLWTALMDLLPMVLTAMTAFFMIDLVIDMTKMVKKLTKRRKDDAGGNG